jgi:hypothetical protein
MIVRKPEDDDGNDDNAGNRAGREDMICLGTENLRARKVINRMVAAN